MYDINVVRVKNGLTPLTNKQVSHANGIYRLGHKYGRNGRSDKRLEILLDVELSILVDAPLKILGLMTGLSYKEIEETIPLAIYIIKREETSLPIK